ncbi:MAG: hypothetical protein JWN74_810 [Acidobacteriaceae bacterium]|jgi:hypothetical protein|nr:hypothetical protein [Acidobacteriaceae bacterium]
MKIYRLSPNVCAICGSSLDSEPQCGPPKVTDIAVLEQSGDGGMPHVLKPQPGNIESALNRFLDDEFGISGAGV